MTDHPGTFGGEPADRTFDWDDRAALHRRDDGGGVLDAMKALNRGTLAEMVALVIAMPEGERGDYVIEKAGDRRIGPGEIRALADRDDYPG